MRIKYALLTVLICLGGGVCFGGGEVLPGPGRLTCQLFTCPEKTFITKGNPVLGWVVKSNCNDDYQSGYQIVVVEGERRGKFLLIADVGGGKHNFETNRDF